MNLNAFVHIILTDTQIIFVSEKLFNLEPKSYRHDPSSLY